MMRDQVQELDGYLSSNSPIMHECRYETLNFLKERRKTGLDKIQFHTECNQYVYLLVFYKLWITTGAMIMTEKMREKNSK